MMARPEDKPLYQDVHFSDHAAAGSIFLLCAAQPGDPQTRRSKYSESSLIDESGQISVALLKQLGIRLSRYGYIGMSDYRMFPILRPGSLIMIDQRQNKVIDGEWLPEHDRPIYFLEMREGFTCSWCKLDGQILTLVPHPVSSYPIEHFLYPRDIEIVGRVVSVFLRLDNPVGTALPPAHDPPVKRSG